MIDRAMLFSDLLRRNQLRRDAQLPLLDVRATYEREVEQALWREHLARHRAKVRADTLAELRAKHGADFGISAGGRWACNLLALKRLRESFVTGVGI